MALAFETRGYWKGVGNFADSIILPNAISEYLKKIN